MKTIILFRHGKSDWAADYGHDHERPLAERGQKGARKMGRFLATSGTPPDHAITSTATRARQTLAIAAEHGGWTGQATITESLYGATPDDVLRALHTTPEDAQTVVVVGHEPTFSRTLSRLIGGGAIEVKTATMARIDVDAARWGDVAFGRGVLVWLLSPGFLRPNRYRKLQSAIADAKEAAETAAEIVTPDEPPEADTPASGD
ncbi:MAG: histidine phosphatase family protein [Bacteroidota bacterium]